MLNLLIWRGFGKAAGSVRPCRSVDRVGPAPHKSFYGGHMAHPKLPGKQNWIQEIELYSVYIKL